MQWFLCSMQGSSNSTLHEKFVWSLELGTMTRHGISRKSIQLNLRRKLISVAFSVGQFMSRIPFILTYFKINFCRYLAFWLLDFILKKTSSHSLPFLHQFSSVQFSRSVMSNSFRPHELQHARPPCPSPTPGVHPDSCSSNQWCYPAISSSVVPFSSCPQSLPTSESFPMSQIFAWGGQSTGVSALASFLPKNTQDWSPLKWTGWIFLGLSRVFSNTTVQKHQFFSS